MISEYVGVEEREEIREEGKKKNLKIPQGIGTKA